MPVIPGAEQSTFDSVAADLKTAAAAGGAIAMGDGLASLGTTLDTTAAFIAPTQADMTTVDSSDTCDGDHVVVKPAPSAGGAPLCECEDYYLGKPAWDSEAARCVYLYIGSGGVRAYFINLLLFRS